MTQSLNGQDPQQCYFHTRDMCHPNRPTRFTEDYDGNVTAHQNGRHFVYDGWNKMVEALQSNNSTIITTSTFDAPGRDILIGPLTNLGDHYYDTMGRSLQTNYSNIHIQYIWAMDYMNDLVIRDRNTDGDTTGTSTGNYGKTGSGLDERFYAQHDGNWDITTVVDTSAAVQEHVSYTPYGDPTIMDSTYADLDDSSTFQWGYRFQGTQWDGIGHFSYMGARIYSTQMGRWMQADPSGYIDSSNLYKSFRDDPAHYTDPAGRESYNLMDADVRDLGLTDLAPGYMFMMRISGLKETKEYAQVTETWISSRGIEGNWKTEPKPIIVIDYWNMTNPGPVDFDGVFKGVSPALQTRVLMYQALFPKNPDPRHQIYDIQSDDPGSNVKAENVFGYSTYSDCKFFEIHTKSPIRGQFLHALHLSNGETITESGNLGQLQEADAGNFPDASYGHGYEYYRTDKRDDPLLTQPSKLTESLFIDAIMGPAANNFFTLNGKAADPMVSGFITPM